MKKVFPLVFILIILSFLSACQKDKNSIEQTFRPVKHSGYSGNNTYESVLKYQNNRIVNINMVVDSDILNYNYFYNGDTVIVNSSQTDEHGQEQLTKEIYISTNSILSSISTFYQESPNFTFKRDFTYENDKLVQINGYKQSEGTITEDHAMYYTYENDKLSKATAYFKAFPDQEMVLEKEIIFSYVNNKLDKEIIYTNTYGYPMELSVKKHYVYEDERLAKIEEYYLNGTVYDIGYVIFTYDNYENIINESHFDPNGDEYESHQTTYEVGSYNSKEYYDIFSGHNTHYPSLNSKLVDKHQLQYLRSLVVFYFLEYTQI